MAEGNVGLPLEPMNLYGQNKDGALLQISVAGETLASEVVYCRSPASRRQGVLRWRILTRGKGALLAMPPIRQGKAGWITSIHTLGVGFPLAVAWLDDWGRIVHSRLAQPWRPYYASPRPASFVLELHQEHLPALEVGRLVNWRSVSEAAP